MPFLESAALAAIPAGLSALGGLLNRPRKPKETPIQSRQRQLIDQLLGSLSGSGPYSSLFSMNEDDFNKSYRDPMMSNFRNQISPQIQQSYISSGQQRGTGLEDALARAGVDLNQQIGQLHGQWQQQGQNRQMQMLGQILGQGAGVNQDRLSGMQSAGQGLSGYLQSKNFSDSIANLQKSMGTQGQTNSQLNTMASTQPYSQAPLGSWDQFSPQNFNQAQNQLPIGDYDQFSPQKYKAKQDYRTGFKSGHVVNQSQPYMWG